MNEGKWSKDVPTQEGWYWFCPPSSWADQDTVIVNVAAHTVWVVGSGGFYDPDDLRGAQWQRIPEPEPPSEAK